MKEHGSDYKYQSIEGARLLLSNNLFLPFQATLYSSEKKDGRDQEAMKAASTVSRKQDSSSSSGSLRGCSREQGRLA